MLIGEEDDYSTDFNVTRDGKHLYFPQDRTVRVWNLASGESTLELHHSSTICDVRSLDWKTVVTTSADPVLRIWDMGRTPTATDVKGLGYWVRYVWQVIHIYAQQCIRHQCISVRRYIYMIY
jgi:WD40 repeat protein